MEQLLQIFIWLPLAAFVATMLIPGNKEKIISGISVGMAGLHLLLAIGFIIYWITKGAVSLDVKHIVLYKADNFEFFIDFYFDRVTAIYVFTGSLITLIVSLFSKYYMHRDEGYKRYFATLLLFYLGYTIVIFAGNFETLFMGWEVLGFCSFLLIAFYRDRYLPVKNGLKVISLYRLGDVCLMLAMWMCHHLFHQNITFAQVHDGEILAEPIYNNASLLVFVSIMILVAALAKSALLPFSSWLPRAMEGPTTSSAVFYGSLSVHLGAFLLLRTYPMWNEITPIKITIIVIGILTSLVATTIARVQPTVKTQIAYSSVTQIGLIFVEIALGLHLLALIHFAGNAFLRTYQLLVSPSVLSYQVHDIFFSFVPKPGYRGRKIFRQVKNTIYMLGVTEWSMDWVQYRFMWSPFKWLGRNMKFLFKKVSMAVLALIFLGGLFSFDSEKTIPEHLDRLLPIVFSIIGLMLVLGSFAERNDARRGWLFVFAGQSFVTLSIGSNTEVPFHQLAMYMGVVLVAATVGWVCLHRMKRISNDISLNRFHGYAYERPMLSFVFLLACLISLGFPLTPAFLGIDLLFTHIYKDQVALIIFTALSFIFIEISLLRIYARIFLGQHKKNDHPIAFRSS